MRLGVVTGAHQNLRLVFVLCLICVLWDSNRSILEMEPVSSFLAGVVCVNCASIDRGLFSRIWVVWGIYVSELNWRYLPISTGWQVVVSHFPLPMLKPIQGFSSILPAWSQSVCCLWAICGGSCYTHTFVWQWMYIHTWRGIKANRDKNTREWSGMITAWSWKVRFGW